MKLYRFDASTSRDIEAHGSRNVSIATIVRLQREAVISYMYIGPAGLVGYHEAAIPQLFLVLQGNGWVRGAGQNRMPIQAGQAAFWERGERHEAGSDGGMTSIIIESPDMAPGALMQPASADET